MQFTLELKKDYALRILEDLQEMQAIQLTPIAASKRDKGRTFDAISVSTKGFTFNRDEANER